MRLPRIAVLFLMIAGSSTSLAQAPSAGRTPANAYAPVTNRAPAQAVEIQDNADGKALPASAAQPTEKPADPAPLESAFDPDKKWLASLVLSPFDMWIPLKYGFSVTYMANESVDYEFEYVRGSFGFEFLEEDLGTVTEQRASLLTRIFPNDTFNYFAGLNYNYTEVDLRTSFTDTVPAGSSDEDFTLLQLGTLGVTLGVGHRWRTTSGVDIGVDWLQIQMPLIRLTQYSPFIDLSGDAEKSDAVAETIRRMRDSPRFTALKFQAGISF